MSLPTPSVPVFVDGLELSPEQCRIYYWVLKKLDDRDANPFHTLIHGGAGTGKTLLLKAIKQKVQEEFGEDSCIATAPTAIAAQIIDSRTIHSTFILEWGQPEINDFLDRIPETTMKNLSEMRDAKLLLIDVINYVSNVDFARIDHCLQKITGIRKPFGGLSVLVFGDFHQLPPIGSWIFEDLEPTFIRKQQEVTPHSPKLWSLFKIVEFPESNNRVIDENERVAFSYMRVGKIQDELYEYLKKLCFVCWDKDQTLEKTVEEFLDLSEEAGDKNIAVLASSNRIVDDINFSIVASIPGVKRFFPVVSAGSEYCYNWDAAKKDICVSPGSLVVFTVNNKEYIIKHGSIGRVEGFGDDTINVRFSDEVIPIRRLPFKIRKENQTFMQFPLRLAFAHTIERAQGASFDGIILVRNQSWSEEEFRCWRDHEDGYGEIYTALSRARNLKNCRITPMRFLDFDVSPKVQEEIIRMRTDCREPLD